MDQEVDLVFRVFFYFCSYSTILDFHQVLFVFGFIYLFGVLRRFQHCTGHITTGSWKGRGNQYIEFARELYCKLPTSGKQVPAFPHKALTGMEPRPQRWEVRVLPLCHRGPFFVFGEIYGYCMTFGVTASLDLTLAFSIMKYYS